MLDLQIHSTVNLERFSEGIKRKVVNLLNDTQKEILSTLTEADSAHPITTWKRKRLSQLQMTIDEIADKSYGQIEKFNRKELKDLSVFTGKEAVANLNKAIGVDIANVTLTKEGLQAIADSTMIDGQVIGKWWEDQKWDFKRKAARQIADATHAVQMGLVQGEAIGEMVRRIRGTALAPGIMDMSKRNATSLVRTSVMQVANEARWQMYEGNKDLIKGYQAVATLDKRTTPKCRSLDGKRWEFAERKRGFPKEPEWKPVMTKAEADEWITDSVEKRTFFHGAPLDAVESIKRNGFSLSQDGVYGPGIYETTAENSAEYFGGIKGKGSKVFKTKLKVKNLITGDKNQVQKTLLDFEGEFEKIKGVGRYNKMEFIEWLQKERGIDGLVMDYMPDPVYGKDEFWSVIFDKKNIVIVE